LLLPASSEGGGVQLGAELAAIFRRLGFNALIEKWKLYLCETACVYPREVADVNALPLAEDKTEQLSMF